MDKEEGTHIIVTIKKKQPFENIQNPLPNNDDNNNNNNRPFLIRYI